MPALVSATLTLLSKEARLVVSVLAGVWGLERGCVPDPARAQSAPASPAQQSYGAATSTTAEKGGETWWAVQRQHRASQQHIISDITSQTKQ